MGGTYRTDAFPAADTGTCPTISIPKPSRPATLRGWLVSRRMRLRSKSDRICAPMPIRSCLGCRPLHLNGGLFPRHRHAINAKRGGRDRAAEFEIVADLRD